MAINAFVEYLEAEKGYSPHTVKAYHRDLQSFSSFCKEHFQRTNIINVNYGEIRSWLLNLVDLGLSNRTINRKVSSLNAFYNFLIKCKLTESNPLKLHKALKTKKKVLVPFSEDEIANVIQEVKEKDSFESSRDALILELLYGTGIRRIELVNLKLEEVDLASRTIKVLGKRNKERIVPLLGSIIESYKNYILYREQLNCIKDKEAVFLTSKGTKIYETLVYRIINDYFSRGSTKAKCSPHVLRHSFATHLLNQGADLNAVKDLLGHTSLAATQVYTHSNISELKKVYHKTHPRNNN